MRLILFLFISGICVLFFSCKPVKEEDERIPDYVIPEDQLITVLTDAYLAESASGMNIKNVSGEKFDVTYPLDPLKDHQISKTKFDSTIIYYSQHPHKLKLVYEKVLEKLSQYQSMIGIEKAMKEMK